MRSAKGLDSPINQSPIKARSKQSDNNYKKVGNKHTVCVCYACFITREFLDSYYNNPFLIRDSDRLVHVPRVDN